MQALKQRTGWIIFWFVIIAQIITGPLTIRSWPFTDYPMFSRAVSDSKEAATLYLVDHYQDGREVPCYRSESGSVGPFDLRLQAYRLNQDEEKLLRHLRHRVRNKKYSEIPEYVSVWNHSAKIVNSEILDTRSMIRKYPYKDLAHD